MSTNLSQRNVVHDHTHIFFQMTQENIKAVDCFWTENSTMDKSVVDQTDNFVDYAGKR